VAARRPCGGQEGGTHADRRAPGNPTRLPSSLERRIDALEAQRLKDIKAKNDQIWEKANRSMHRVQGFMGGLLVGAWFMVAIRWLAGA
jgi:hypothetical protein